MQKIKAIKEPKDQVFSSLAQRLTIVDVFIAFENASSGITLYSSFDFSPRCPNEISFFTNQLHSPPPVVHKFVKPKVSDYSNKLRVG